jgi:hypothetical protein
MARTETTVERIFASGWRKLKCLKGGVGFEVKRLEGAVESVVKNVEF